MQVANYDVFGVVVNGLLDITARTGDTDTLRVGYWLLLVQHLNYYRFTDLLRGHAAKYHFTIVYQPSRR